jgi:predicted nucleotidyltransferase
MTALHSSTENIISVLSEALNESSHVVFAYLFGSRTGTMVSQTSDIDIAVFLNKKKTALDDYLSLYTKLSRTLKSDTIDLVVVNNTKNIILLDSIVRNGLLLCDKDRPKRISFEVLTIHRAIDFRQQRKTIFGW